MLQVITTLSHAAALTEVRRFSFLVLELRSAHQYPAERCRLLASSEANGQCDAPRNSCVLF